MNEREDEPGHKNSNARNGSKFNRAAWVLVVITFSHLIVMQYQLQVRNKQLGRIENSTNELVQFTHDIQADDEPDPELQRVFAAVFQTLELLCNQFPDNQTCQTEGE